MEIYKTTNLTNGKIYIGQSKYSNNDYLGSGKILIYAIKKHGKENFIKEIIEKCKTKDELDIREIYWINYFNSKDPSIGYNIANGGQGGNIVNILEIWQTKFGIDEGNKKYLEYSMSKGRSGKDSSRYKELLISDDEIIKRYLDGEGVTSIGKSCGHSTGHKVKNVLKQNNIHIRSASESAVLRKKPSEETRKKMSDAHTGNGNGMKGKSVYARWVELYGKDIADEKMKLYKENMSNSLKTSGFNKGDKHYSKKQINQ